ncbi:MAG: hypothetical protein DCC55_11350 [Chloroflexi bacterium]|nr:MAG: hypothetical protein DCC55_11350 [Chloroflexota bacterium]
MPNGATPISRKVVRDAIGAGLVANLPTAQAVYPYQRSKIGGVATAVRFFSASSLRPMMAEQGIRSELGFIVQLWVIYNSATQETWGESEAEAKLDALEHEFATWVSANNLEPNPLWLAAGITAIRYSGFSFVDVHKIANETYLVEDIPIIAEVYG